MTHRPACVSKAKGRVTTTLNADNGGHCRIESIDSQPGVRIGRDHPAVLFFNNNKAALTTVIVLCFAPQSDPSVSVSVSFEPERGSPPRGTAISLEAELRWKRD
jgi:hypothetical protein